MKWLRALNKSNLIAFDIIATNKLPMEARIIGFSFWLLMTEHTLYL